MSGALVYRVSRQAALNPVARAVARARLASRVLTLQIRLYLTEAGEPCSELVIGVGKILSMITWAAEKDRAVREGAVRGRLHGAISACIQMEKSGRYDPVNTVSLSDSLDLAVALSAKIKPETLREAIHLYGAE